MTPKTYTAGRRPYTEAAYKADKRYRERVANNCAAGRHLDRVVRRCVNCGREVEEPR